MSGQAMPTSLTTALTAAQGEIEQALDILLPREEGREAPLFAAMRYAAMGGGKRMRGFLVLEGARQFNFARASALRVAAAIEMLHAYSLVHDDLPAMDDDDLRYEDDDHRPSPPRRPEAPARTAIPPCNFMTHLLLLVYAPEL